MLVPIIENCGLLPKTSRYAAKRPSTRIIFTIDSQMVGQIKIEVQYKEMNSKDSTYTHPQTINSTPYTHQKNYIAPFSSIIKLKFLVDRGLGNALSSPCRSNAARSSSSTFPVTP